MIIESEKTEADRTVETIRIRNEELRKKYEQLIMDNDHRIHLDDHVREINEMKRLTGSIYSLFYLLIFSIVFR
jgi:predicted metal-dependent hydrolase